MFAPLVPFDPFRSPFWGFRGLFDDRPLSMMDNGPRYEIRESQQALRIELEVPRYHSEDITVQADAESGLITVTGERRGSGERNDDAAQRFDNLLVASSPLTSFRRSFHVATSLYDMAQVQHSVADGVLTITVPKLQGRQLEVAQSKQPREQQQRLTQSGTQEQPHGQLQQREGDTHRQQHGGQLQAHGRQDEEGRVATRSLFGDRFFGDGQLMRIRKSEDEKALTYDVLMSRSIPRENISLELVGNMLRVKAKYQHKTEHSSDSATYEASVTVPRNTQPQDIHSEYEDGRLRITLDKPHGSTPAINVNQNSTNDAARSGGSRA
jgi:HSP20 family molecular chaperone IbpA